MTRVPDHPADPGFLGGWKSIAAYLGRDQSTVRRWAAVSGLPVYRPHSGVARRGAAVYALIPELEGWVKRFGPPAILPSAAALPGKAGEAAPVADAGESAAFVPGPPMPSQPVPGSGADPGQWPPAVPGPVAGTAAEDLPAPMTGGPMAGAPVIATAGASALSQVSEEARSLYHQGIYLWQKRSGEALSAAAERLQGAVRLAPEFAPAHAELAVVYDLLVDYGVLSEADGHRLAGASARRALALEPGNARAHCVLADIVFYGERDFPASLAQFRTAVSLDASDPLCHHWLGAALSLTGGQDEAREMIERAKQLYPASRQVVYTEAMNLLARQEFARARQLLLDLVLHEPGFANGFRFLAFAELGLGRPAAWAAAWSRCTLLKGDAGSAAVLSGLAGAAGSSGDPHLFAPALRERLGAGGDSYLLAHIGALCGDWEGALGGLSGMRDCTAFYNAVDPAFAPARRLLTFRKGLQAARLPA